jgi:uncharacterized protein DUF4112
VVALLAATPIPILRAMHGVYHNYSPREAAQSVARLEALAWLMDSQFVLPSTTFRFGLDPLVGLIPVVGDIISGLISTYLIWEARRLGALKWLIARMMANTLFDTAVGSVAIVGDAFDALFRSNVKTMALLRRHMERRGLAWPKCPIIHGEPLSVG